MGEGEAGPWRAELNNFSRAFCGAFLFGVPLLFTQEMWSLGAYTGGWKLLAMLVLALGVSLGLSYFAGFRSEQQRSFGRHVDQAVDAVAVAAIASAIVLVVLNRISFDNPLDSALAQIVVQVAPLSMGASIARDLFPAGQSREGTEPGQRESAWLTTFKDLGATAAGGIFVSFNIAPTEEIRLLAGELTYGHLVALIALSLVLTYAVVFESGFDPDANRPADRGLLRGCLTETSMAYVVSLLVALGALYFFNEVSVGDPLPYVLAQTLVLGLPTALGGAAGRLVI